MAEDTRDYIDQTQSRSIHYSGKELTPQEMAHEFAKWDIDTRVNALESLQAERGELSITQATKRWAHERALRNTHEMLRKAGR